MLPSGSTMLKHELLERYGSVAVPRYTSYPPANLWKPTNDTFARNFLAGVGARPLSIYVHVPFCHKLCLYCGCNMLVTRSQTLVERYMSAIEAEMMQAARTVTGVQLVEQIHLGGGTPTFLSDEQLERLMAALDKSFPRSAKCESSIEVHPPVTTHGQLRTLRSLGFSRLSMGVQDFDPNVQARIRRKQPFAQTQSLIEEARALGFTSINLDLMYGLPLQTASSFGRTLDLVEVLRPERIALFGYAHMPSLKKHQAVLNADLPTPAERLQLLELGIERLQSAGYVHIGLDHFALPDDELCLARADGSLRRNFMGYTTCRASDTLAFGPSAIAEVGGDFLQNERDTKAWAERIERSLFAGVRGWRSSADDRRRSEIIHTLFCSLQVELSDMLSVIGNNAPMLAALERDGLVETTGTTLTVTKSGQLLLRNIAAVFDAYLGGGQQQLYSAAV